jgi:hypothetical protein
MTVTRTGQGPPHTRQTQQDAFGFFWGGGGDALRVCVLQFGFETTFLCINSIQLPKLRASLDEDVLPPPHDQICVDLTTQTHMVFTHFRMHQELLHTL